MSTPTRPTAALHEGPATSCIIAGKALGWTNCGPTSTAMGIDRSTHGAQRPSPCDVRRKTGDTVGGTTLPQNVAVASTYGVSFETHVGTNVCAPSYAAGQARVGRGFILQGNAGVLVGTAYRSTGGYVNHAVWVNETRGGTASVPAEALVYDPAADGRTASWGKAATSPQWWPWSLILKFAAALHPWGDTDARLLGPGKFYCAIGPVSMTTDAPPPTSGLTLRYGGVAIKPPQVKTIAVPAGQRANVRTRPTTASTKTSSLPNGTKWACYQVTKTGQLLAGSRTWYGNIGGNRWLHSTSF